MAATLLFDVDGPTYLLAHSVGGIIATDLLIRNLIVSYRVTGRDDDALRCWSGPSPAASPILAAPPGAHLIESRFVTSAFGSIVRGRKLSVVARRVWGMGMEWGFEPDGVPPAVPVSDANQPVSEGVTGPCGPLDWGASPDAGGSGFLSAGDGRAEGASGADGSATRVSSGASDSVPSEAEAEAASAAVSSEAARERARAARAAQRAEAALRQSHADAGRLGADGDDVVLAGLDLVRAGLAMVSGADLGGRSGVLAREGVREGFRMVQAAQGAWLGLLADLDDRPGVVSGARPGREAQLFLSAVLLRTPEQAGADVRAARAVGVGADPARGGLPQLGAALGRGDVSREHVDKVVEAVRKVPVAALARPMPVKPADGPDGESGGESGDGSGGDERAGDEAVEPAGARVDAFCAALCRRHDARQVGELVKHLRSVLDPDGDDDGFDPAGYERRGLTYAQEDSGMLAGRLVLDPAGAAVFRTAIDNLSAPDPARTETAQDGSQTTVRDARTAAQRRADAVVQMARLSLTHVQTKAGKNNEPARIVIHTGLAELREALLAATAHHHDHDHDHDHDGDRSEAREAREAREAGGPEAPEAFGGPRRGSDCEQLGPIRAGLLGRLACDSILQKALLAPNGAVLDLGRDTRTVTAAQRRALNARDRGCVIPGCTAPPAWCEGHHVTFWRNGGPTDIDNLALTCGRHHTQIHLGIWELVMREGIAWARPPEWIDAQRRLIRNTLRVDADTARTLGAQLRLNIHPPDPPPERPAA